MTFQSPSIIQLQVIGKNSSEFSYTTGTSNGRLTLSDHSRSPLSIDYDIIEQSQRMANGTMRKYVVSKKRVMSCSWDMLPTIDQLLADNNANAINMKSFYEINCNLKMQLSLFHKRNNSSDTSYVETYNVFWSNFSYDVIKRYRNFDYWNVIVEFTEA